MPGIAAIHYPLRHVDAGSGDVRAPAHIGHFAHRTAVNSHPHGISGCALSACAISSAHRAGSSELLRKTSAMPSPVGSLTSCSLVDSATCEVAYALDLGQPAQPLLLLFDQELGIADQVDEQDVPDLERTRSPRVLKIQAP